ncbi:MAG TPA: adenylate/guanylate cyclase domain-containing protein [Anaerolineae bacterium]|nr:adenylate/guanylate cyclase domain-containing protein [Anaerolineae bacterium]
MADYPSNRMYSSATTVPGQDSVAALRDGLTNLTRMVARHRGTDALLAEFSQHVLALQDLLANLEQKLATQAGERDELDALYGICQAIGSSLNLTEVLNEVMDQIIRLTGAERSFLMLIDPATGELEFRAARNMDRETIASFSFEISRSIVKQVAATGQPVVTTNAQMDPRFKAQESVIGYNLRSILCVPLRVRGRITGVIYADNRILTGLFTDRDRDVLTVLAGQAAVAIENALLFQSVANAKALMDNVFASITSGVITTDTEEQITLFNRAAERVLRVPSTAIVGSRLSDTLPALAEALAPMVDQVKRYGEPVVEFENEIFLPGSGQVHLRTSLSPLKNTNEETQGTAIVIDDLTEQRRLESRYQLFQRYLPPAVIERLPNDPHELRLGGQRQEITSLFADIRGFTNFSRQHDPETLVEVLNKYLAVGAQAVLDEEGTLDKIMGDCIVAFFNAPLTQSDHVLRAVRAALKIREGIARLHEDVPASYRLNYGVGINVGDAVVGNVGTAQQMNYTAIGSGVNLASRLQEAAAPGQILLPQAAYQRVQKYVEARLLSPITVAGFSEPIVVYELLEWRS